MTADVWKHLRAGNIGASEVAALFGESSYLTYYRLWHIKRGYIEAPNLDDNERVQAGKFMEQGAIHWYNSKYKTNFFQPHQYVKHIQTVGMACTPDAFDREAGIMAQVKIVDGLQFLRNWEYERDEITKAPLEILLQVQHEMECCDINESHLIVVVGGNRLLRMICFRDREIGRLIRDKVWGFWDRKTPPEPEFERDGGTIVEIRKTLPEKQFTDLSDDKNLYIVIREAQKATVQRNKLQDKVDRYNAEVTHLIGGAVNIRCKDMVISLPSGRITPKYISEKETF